MIMICVGINKHNFNEHTVGQIWVAEILTTQTHHCKRAKSFPECLLEYLFTEGKACVYFYTYTGVGYSESSSTVLLTTVNSKLSVKYLNTKYNLS